MEQITVVIGDRLFQVVPEREQHRPATPYERIPVTLVEENA
ncbi:hypothetical protein MJO10_29365 [Salmonella enterica subsp. enterica serovar Anatum]|nr:hypothetical protein [Salmonella enterica subsp. enterica serovar Anatum]